MTTDINDCDIGENNNSKDIMVHNDTEPKNQYLKIMRTNYCK